MSEVLLSLGIILAAGFVVVSVVLTTPLGERLGIVARQTDGEDDPEPLTWECGHDADQVFGLCRSCRTWWTRCPQCERVACPKCGGEVS